MFVVFVAPSCQKHNALLKLVGHYELANIMAQEFCVRKMFNFCNTFVTSTVPCIVHIDKVHAFRVSYTRSELTVGQYVCCLCGIELSVTQCAVGHYELANIMLAQELCVRKMFDFCVMQRGKFKSILNSGM